MLMHTENNSAIFTWHCQTQGAICTIACEVGMQLPQGDVLVRVADSRRDVLVLLLRWCYVMVLQLMLKCQITVS